MKIRLKETHCPLCLAELVIDGKITCADGCDLPQEGWHKETESKIKPALEYLERLL